MLESDNAAAVQRGHLIKSRMLVCPVPFAFPPVVHPALLWIWVPWKERATRRYTK